MMLKLIKKFLAGHMKTRKASNEGNLKETIKLVSEMK